MYKKLFLSIVFLSLCLVFISIDLTYAQDAVKSEEENITPLALTIGGGWLEKAKFYAESNSVTNDSTTTWVDAFNVTLTLKDTAPAQCLAIKYSGECAVNGSAGTPHSAFRALVDSTPAEGQGATGFVYVEASEYNYWTYCSFTWWKCGLAGSGTSHTVQVQFQPVNSGDTALIRQRTLILEYKK